MGTGAVKKEANPKKKNNQIVGNVGLYYACYRLSQMEWNVLPTSSNAKGIDIITYNEDASRKITIQVKSLSRKSPVPLGNTLDHIFGDFFITLSRRAGKAARMFYPNTCRSKK